MSVRTKLVYSVWIDNFRWSLGHGLLCDSVTFYYGSASGKWITHYHPTPSSLQRVLALLANVGV
jgi:hypothetical protein